MNVTNNSCAQIAAFSDVVAVGNGYTHNVALRKDGTVWQRGHPVRKPSRVPQLDRVKAIAAGAWFALALKEDGTVWQWGRDCPLRRVREIRSPLALSAGWNMSLALIGSDQPAKSAPQAPEDRDDTPDAAATRDTPPGKQVRPGSQLSTRIVLSDTVKPVGDGHLETLTAVRVKKLKASLDHLKLMVTRRGGPQERNPGDMLTLMVNEARGVHEVQISRAEAETIIDDLAEAGHLANARDVTQVGKIRYPPGRYSDHGRASRNGGRPTAGPPGAGRAL